MPSVVRRLICFFSFPFIYVHILFFLVFSCTDSLPSSVRAKIQELSQEIGKLTQEIDQYNQDNATYLTFEKRHVCVGVMLLYMLSLSSCQYRRMGFNCECPIADFGGFFFSEHRVCCLYIHTCANLT